MRSLGGSFGCRFRLVIGNALTFLRCHIVGDLKTTHLAV
jgi:hypothetical protein